MGIPEPDKRAMRCWQAMAVRESEVMARRTASRAKAPRCESENRVQLVVIDGLGNMPVNRRAVPSVSENDVSRSPHVRRDLRGLQLLAGKPPTTTAWALVVKIYIRQIV